MEDKKPIKVYFDETVRDKMFFVYEDGTVVEEPLDFSSSKMIELLNDNGIELTNDGLVEARDKGIVAAFTTDATEEEKNAFIGASPVGSTGDVDDDSLEDEDEDEYTDDDSLDDDELEEEQKSGKGKKIVAGILGAAAVIGGLTLFHSCSNDDIKGVIEQPDDTPSKEEEDFLKKLLANMTPSQQQYFGSALTVVENFNETAKADDNFKLDKDTSDLSLTVDETVALKAVLNNYSAEELYDVFGTVGFDAENMMDLAKSAYAKMSVYYMNATKPSGISALIEDKAAKEFFEKQETRVLAFNANPSEALADEVIKNTYYSYVYGGSTGEYEQINNSGVAWFATSTIYGYELANRNIPEYLEIHEVDSTEKDKYPSGSAEVGMKLSDIVNIVNKEGLYKSINDSFSDTVEELSTKQSLEKTVVQMNAKTQLVTELRNANENTLANKVTNGAVTEELLNEIAGASKDGSNAVESYRGAIASVTDKEAKVVAMLELAENKYNVSKTDVTSLVNNRFRTKPLDKVVVDTNNGPVDIPIVDKDEDGNNIYDGDEFGKLTDDEKHDFIVNNGTVVDKEDNKDNNKDNNKDTGKDVVVKEEDLTDKEKEDVKTQKEILTEVEKLSAELQLDGANDASVYTNEKGVYKFNKKIVNKYNGEQVDTSKMSIFNIVTHSVAFGDGTTVKTSDEQVKQRIAEDKAISNVSAKVAGLSDEAKEYLKKEYGSNWQSEFVKASYEKGYTEQFNAIIRKAIAYGDVLRTDAEKAYINSQKQNEQLNNSANVNTNTNTNTNTSTGTTNNTNSNTNNDADDYDPWLDPNLNKPLSSSTYSWDAEYKALTK